MTENIFETIIDIVAEKARHLSYDKTFASVVYGSTADGRYQISYENRLRAVPSTLNCGLKNGQAVWVKVPNGKLKDMHICGLRNKYERSIVDTSELGLITTTQIDQLFQ